MAQFLITGIPLNYGGGRNLIMSNYVNLGGFGYVNHVFNYGGFTRGKCLSITVNYGQCRN